ncbi:hypothetical protein T440DRAFT_457845 [Plenodomus tracheiphilus IPT5]|uniref:BTB domain-containing protein n=1 Tax=Plenodomus tracheiphilus IPT5 TaxID=1408161 RepID=A0A6A7AU11_9PLEO|nr:hypothetical protein T440DRAFT_457845 [Plenodomus tracheiphilus IPT5]
MNQAEDVEVTLGRNRRYKFHSGTLARNSTLFADMLTEQNAAKLSIRARNAGVKVRWLIELTRLPDGQYPAGCLALVELTQNGDRTDGRNGLIVNENGRIPKHDKAIAAYESVFYAFYNNEITIDDSEMSTALQDCYQLLQISDYLGCTRLISKPIEVALMKHGQDLFRSIQGKPHAWIDMACRIKSELIFRECMIHLVGNWKILQLDRAVKDRLHDNPGLRAIIEKYHRNLQTQCRKLELAVTTHYPGKLAHPVDDLPIKREAYAKDILVWMALSWYRHWVGQRLITEQGRLAKDSGYALYKNLGTAGEAYMDKSVINQFHTKFPMTKKALNVVENHVWEVKECIKDIVNAHGILKVKCQLDVHRFPVAYMTCTDFQREDLPWLKKVAGTVAAAKKREFQRGGNDIAKMNLDRARVGRERSGSGEGEGEGLEEDEEMEGEVEEEDSNEEVGDGSKAKRARLA